ncbi:MAG: GNAT family N-acetyltransferase [Methylococcaceae bacterium]|nr:MAG: GNAT family N-acetyltransferase [Methylococcaceae bacterium]
MLSAVHARDAAATSRSRRFEAFIASNPATIRAAQALRYRVFAGEMGATLHTPYPGLDWDEVDEHCDHLVVVDNVCGALVGTTRLLSDRQALKLGRFYSESEFHLERVLGLGGRFLEIGRTCVDRRVRGSAVLSSLWSELAGYALQGGYDYLMGCASIPAGPSGFAVDAVYSQIEAEQMGPANLVVRPKHAIPEELKCESDDCGMPPLLKAYLRLGAWVCGEPCWDEDFNVMDVFILLPIERLQARYERHFMNTRLHGSDHAQLAEAA